MIGVDSPTGINAMLQATPGAVSVSYGGVVGWGHKGLPPDVVFEDPRLTGAATFVTVAACYFPDIGVSETAGQDGTVGTLIDVDGHTWRVAEVLDVSPDGAVVSIRVTHPS